jgi:hypothetical protein
MEFDKRNRVNSKIYELNIGGKIFATLDSTLIKSIKCPKTNKPYAPHFLQELITENSAEYLDKNQRIFIDRDPKYFGHILDYLRNSDNYKLPSNDEDFFGVLNEARYFNINGILDLIISGILTQKHIEKIAKFCEFTATQKWNLIYRGSRDGFKSENFHSKCDGVSNTITIVKSSNSNIFGAYCKLAWTTEGGYKQDKNIILFSLENDIGKPARLPTSFYQYIFCDKDFGPCFGKPGDEYSNPAGFYIASIANENLLSYSKKVELESHKIQNERETYYSFYLAGSHYFKVNEVEVFQISNN